MDGPLPNPHTYQVAGDRGVDGPGDDEADGVLSGLAQDGRDLLGAHAPQAHVPDGEQVVAVLQAAVLQGKRKEKVEMHQRLFTAYLGRDVDAYPGVHGAPPKSLKQLKQLQSASCKSEMPQS